jgi:hypothetical protein
MPAFSAAEAADRESWAKLLAPDIPAPAKFWGIVARSALHMNEPIASAKARAIEQRLAEYLPAEGSC